MKIVAKKDRKLLLINTGNTQNENEAETITLSSSDYDYTMLYYARTPASRNEVFCIVLEKNKDTELLYSDCGY